MNYTTLEQSKKLIEAGLDPEAADLRYIENYPIVFENSIGLQKGDIPCWSLGQLIELIGLQGTESIEFNIYNTTTKEYEELNGKHRVELNLTNWYKPFFGEDYVDCLVQAVIWLNEKEETK